MDNRTMIKATSILCPILGLTWLIGLIPVTKETVAVAYVFVTLNSTQVKFANKSSTKSSKISKIYIDLYFTLIPVILIIINL